MQDDRPEIKQEILTRVRWLYILFFCVGLLFTCRIVYVMFFCSILTIFNALRLDKRFTQVEAETQLLRERSIRMQERRYRQTTHSAIVRRLEERGIELRDAGSATEIIE